MEGLCEINGFFLPSHLKEKDDLEAFHLFWDENLYMSSKLWPLCSLACITTNGAAHVHKTLLVTPDLISNQSNSDGYQVNSILSLFTDKFCA